MVVFIFVVKSIISSSMIIIYVVSIAGIVTMVNEMIRCTIITMSSTIVISISIIIIGIIIMISIYD